MAAPGDPQQKFRVRGERLMSTQRAIGFTQWLLWQECRGDQVGLLARAVAEDPGWPRHGNSLHEFLSHIDGLESPGPHKTREVINAAWEEYREKLCKEVQAFPFFLGLVGEAEVPEGDLP